MPNLTQTQYDDLSLSLAIIEVESKRSRQILANATPDTAPVGIPVPPIVIPSVTPILTPNWTAATPRLALGIPTTSTILNEKLLTMDTTVLYNGHPTIRADQPALTDSTPQMGLMFPEKKRYQHLWVKLTVRMSKGWTTDGVSPGGKGYKWIGLGWAGYNGRATIEYVNTNQYNHNWYVTDGMGKNVSTVEAVNGDHVTTEWVDEQWIPFYWQVKPVSATRVGSRFWIEKRDTGLREQPGFVGTMLNEAPLPWCDRVDLGKNFNQLRKTAQSFWIGDFQVVDGTAYANPFTLPGV